MKARLALLYICTVYLGMPSQTAYAGLAAINVEYVLLALCNLN